jgi:hypothetical protein
MWFSYTCRTKTTVPGKPVITVGYTVFHSYANHTLKDRKKTLLEAEITLLVSTSCCSCRGETMSLNCDQQRAHSSSSTWYMSMESHSVMILTGECLENNPSQWHFVRRLTRASAVRGRRLTAWALAWLLLYPLQGRLYCPFHSIHTSLVVLKPIFKNSRLSSKLLILRAEVGLEVNSEKSKYMLMSLKKAGQKHSIKIGPLKV